MSSPTAQPALSDLQRNLWQGERISLSLPQFQPDANLVVSLAAIASGNTTIPVPTAATAFPERYIIGDHERAEYSDLSRRLVYNAISSSSAANPDDPNFDAAFELLAVQMGKQGRFSSYRAYDLRFLAIQLTNTYPRGWDDPAYRAEFERILNENQSRFPVLTPGNPSPQVRQEARTAFVREAKDYIALYFTFLKLCSGHPLTPGQGGGSAQGFLRFNTMWQVYDRVDRYGASQRQEDYELVSASLRLLGREHLEPMGMFFGPDMPYQYGVRLSSWRGVPPRGQLQIDIISAHYATMQQLINLQGVFANMIGEAGASAPAQRQAYTACWQLFDSVRGDVRNVGQESVLRLVQYGFDGYNPITGLQENAVGPLSEEQHRIVMLLAEIDRRQGNRQVTGAPPFAFQPLHVGDLVSSGFRTAQGQGLISGLPPVALNDNASIAELQAALDTYGGDQVTAARLNYQAISQALTPYVQLHNSLDPIPQTIRAAHQSNPTAQTPQAWFDQMILGRFNTAQSGLVRSEPQWRERGMLHPYVPNATPFSLVVGEWNRAFDGVADRTMGMNAGAHQVADIFGNYVTTNDQHNDLAYINAFCRRFGGQYSLFFRAAEPPRGGPPLPGARGAPLPGP